MLEISFEQIVFAIGGLLATMAGAIAFMFKWVLDQFEALKSKLNQCETKHVIASTELAELKGKIEAMDKYNPKELVDCFVIAVEEILHKKLGGDN